MKFYLIFIQSYCFGYVYNKTLYKVLYLKLLFTNFALDLKVVNNFNVLKLLLAKINNISLYNVATKRPCSKIFALI